MICLLVIAITIGGCQENGGGAVLPPSPTPSLSLSFTNTPNGVFYYNEYYDTIDFIVEVSDNSEQTIVWESSNTEIAQVNKEGTVTIYGEGSSVIKASLEKDSSVFTSFQLTTKYSIVNVTGRPQDDQIDIHGTDVITLGYSFLDDTITGDVVWKSSNESVLTIDENGAVEVRGLGVSTINVYWKNDPNVFYAFDLTVVDRNYANVWYESFTTASIVGTNCIGKLKIIGYNVTDMEIEDVNGKRALLISGNSADTNNAFITVGCSNLIAGNQYRVTVEYEIIEGVHTLDVYRFDSLTTENGENGRYSTEFFAQSPSWKFKISSTEKVEYKLKIKNIFFELIDSDNVNGGEDVFT